MRSRSLYTSVIGPTFGVCCLVGLQSCSERRVPETDCPKPSGSADERPSAAENQARGPLQVTLEQKGARLKVHFQNRADRNLIVIRPLGGELLEKMPGLPGVQTLPPPDYRFEATSTAGGTVHRGSYAPMWPSASAASEGLGDAGPALDATVDLKPGQSSEQGVDLPFDLPSGQYTVRFSYDYFRSSDQLPPGWFTGTAQAPPIRVSISR